MATINEIAIKISADTSDAVSQFEKIDRHIKKIERQQAILTRAGKGGGKLFQDLEAEKQRLRSLGDELERTTPKVKSFFTELSKPVPPRTAEQKLIDKLRHLDSEIKRLKAEEEFLRSQGLDPTTSAIYRQRQSLEMQRQSAIATSTAMKTLATANVQVAKTSHMSQMGMGQYQMAMSQAAFGVEDFMTQIQYGLGPALRAAGNNISMVAHSLGGFKAGAVIGITTAVLPSLINLFWDVGEEAKKSEKKIKSWRKTVQDLQGIQEEGIEERQTMRDIGRMDSSKQADDSIQKWEDENIQANERIEGMNKLVVDRQEDVVKQMENKGINSSVTGVMAKNLRGGTKDLEDSYAAADAEQDRQIRAEEAREKWLNTRSGPTTITRGGIVTVGVRRGSDAEREANRKKLAELKRQKEALREQADLNNQYNRNLQRAQEMQQENQRKIESNERLINAAKRRGNELAAQERAREEEKLRLLRRQKRVQQQLNDLSKEQEKVVAGGFSSNINRGALMQTALQEKYRDERDVKREDLQTELKGIREDLKNVDQFKVVGG